MRDSAPGYPEVLETPIRWPNGNRCFICPDRDDKLLARIEIEAGAIDDGVLDAIDALERALIDATAYNSHHAVAWLVGRDAQPSAKNKRDKRLS